MSGSVFVTGATGYIGRRLVPVLLNRGHRVRALVRAGSESKTPSGCQVVVGNPFDPASIASRLDAGDALVQLVGVPHPSPAKAQQFLDIDLRSALASIDAARSVGVSHFVYVSVAQPAPIMRAYQEARAQAESTLATSGLPHTIIRPWYVLGPGHRWPYLLLPMYWLFERMPSTREGAQRLGLVTLRQMIDALVHAVEHPAAESRVVDVPQIRAARLQP
jgi:uncharacterized protein YbjT (DUF2867 family)